MFLQNWKLSLIAIVMIPLASLTAKILGKRMSKISTQAQEKSGDLNRYLIDLFKNHKIIKIFQRENYEENRSEKFVKNLKEKSAKIALPVVSTCLKFILSSADVELLNKIKIPIDKLYFINLIMLRVLFIIFKLCSSCVS
jgi:subfamily B ATP-binding cassette protein MsbA